MLKQTTPPNGRVFTIVQIRSSHCSHTVDKPIQNKQYMISFEERNTFPPTNRVMSLFRRLAHGIMGLRVNIAAGQTCREQ